MKEVLADIQSGKFTKDWMDECKNGQKNFLKTREKLAEHPVEKVGAYLRGEEGRRLKQRIANGQWKPINDVNEKEPTQGYDVFTTINLNIQDITHSALLEQLEKYKADHGSAVVMETKTGKIRAIVNLGQ